MSEWQNEKKKKTQMAMNEPTDEKEIMTVPFLSSYITNLEYYYMRKRRIIGVLMKCARDKTQ